MFDLGRSFLAGVERDPEALAIVDDGVRLSYRAWYRIISSVVDGLLALGLTPGERIVTALLNRWQAATLHWACQFAGLVITPVNWRMTGAELAFAVENAGARALVFEAASAEAAAAVTARPLLRIGIHEAEARADLAFAALAGRPAPDARPMAAADAISLMLYTSGTTGRPKGVPRRHRAERAGAIAHVAQNLYGGGERTLGVMPLYHTMGVRSLLAMSLIGGCFVCLPRFDVVRALELIAAERITNLYLVPTLYHDLVFHPSFPAHDVSSVRKLGFAGASMTDGLLKALDAAFRPALFVNHYGSSEIYTFTVDQDARRKPGSAGRAGINQRIRVVPIGSADPNAPVAPGAEGEIIADAASDEAFDGYWNRPDADQRAFHAGWYFTGDIGYIDAEGDLFVTGRVDDMIISGGENISPVEIERCLSLHAAVSEIAVVGLPDPRWGQMVTAFVKARAPVGAAALDAHCRASGLANFKRPRRYVFVAALPRSPVGKLLRRKLVAGEFDPDPAAADPSSAKEAKA